MITGRRSLVRIAGNRAFTSSYLRETYSPGPRNYLLKPWIAPKMSHSNSFLLGLANDQQWLFMSVPACIQLMDRLAAVMQLESCDPEHMERVPRIVVASDQPRPLTDRSWRLPESVTGLCKGFPDKGWRVQSVGWVSLMSHPETKDAVCIVGKRVLEMRQVSATWPTLVPVYEQVRRSGGMVAHCGLLVRGEDGFLLVGPSGMGKSTCARRIGLPWKALCDDQALVVKTAPGTYHCHPLPTWSTLWGDPTSTTWPVRQSVRLRGIFFLERHETNRIEALGKAQAAAMLSRSAQRVAVPFGSDIHEQHERAFKQLIFDNACDLVPHAPCFLLYANLTARFWEQMESVL